MTKYRKNFAASLLLACVSPVAIVAATPAMAQEAARSFDIPAQPLASAILEYSRQSGQHVAAPMDVVRGKRSSAVKGSMAPDAALRELLRGTGLRVSKGAGGALVISGNASSGGQAAGEIGKAEVRGAGAVVDQNGGAALKGAFVELIGTGRTATTDEFGRYRFSGVNEVRQVRVSYLGFPAAERYVSFADGRPTTTIQLSYGTTPDEIVVVAGIVSARAKALNQERAAENTRTVVSSDLLGTFNGTTISDALRRAPGVSFQQNPITGEGQNITIRGVAPDYNQVRLNGVAVQEGTGAGRAPDLSTLLAGSVSEITISKTLLPNQDSSGTGGLVEIETKSPLNRPRRFFELVAEGRERGKGFGSDFQASGTASAKLGANDNFGVSASYQYRRQNVTSLAYLIGSGQLGPYLPLNSFGQPFLRSSDIDPRTQFPFEAGVDGYYPNDVTVTRNHEKSELTGLTLTAEWQPSDATSLRVDYLRSDRTSTSFAGSAGLFAATQGYSLQPIPALGGEQRGALSSDDLYFRKQNYQYARGNKQTSDNLSFRGRTETGKFLVEYGLGQATGSTELPQSISFNSFSSTSFTPELILSSATDPQTGLIPSLLGRRTTNGMPLFHVTGEGEAVLNDASTLPIDMFTQSEDIRGRSRARTANFSVRYSPAAGPLKYIDVGFDYKNARSSQRSSLDTQYFPVDPQNFSSVGLPLTDDAFVSLNRSRAGLRLAREADVSAFLAGVGSDDRFFEVLNPVDPLNGQSYTRERDFAPYVQARLEFGKVEVIGGVRYSSVQVAAGFPVGVSVFDEDYNFDLDLYNRTREIISAKARQTDLLPRVVVNWRLSENSIVRAGYFSTVARPALQSLSSPATFTYLAAPVNGPQFNQPLLDVQLANPDLKPAFTQNFDLSIEHYDDRVGVLKFGIFYKRIENLLESVGNVGLESLDGVDLPDDPAFPVLPANTYVIVTKPVNNPKAGKIWGFEASVEKRLNFLPGALSGLGTYLNLTYANSSKDQPATWFNAPVYDAVGNVTGFETRTFVYEDVSFSQSPKYSGTAGLTYSKYGFDASLFYSYQSRRIASQIGDYGLSQYFEASDSLDLRAEYRFKVASGTARIYLLGNDLLRGKNDPNLTRSIGGVGETPKVFVSGNYIGGRSFTLGAAFSF